MSSQESISEESISESEARQCGYSSEPSITEGEDEPYHESPYCSTDEDEWLPS
jgi:hypothetical protein